MDLSLGSVQLLPGDGAGGWVPGFGDRRAGGMVVPGFGGKRNRCQDLGPAGKGVYQDWGTGGVRFSVGAHTVWAPSEKEKLHREIIFFSNVKNLFVP